MIIQKSAGKSAWTDRNERVLSDRRYTMVGAKEGMERSEKYHNGTKNTGKSGEEEYRVLILYKQPERRY